ncbi:MAG TPA: NAD(P)-binding domain-containing protein [Kofleriaceae bacterium]
MKIAILGSGVVGETLAKGFLGDGHHVMRGTREPAKLADWHKGAGANASVGTFHDCAAFGDIVILSVKGAAAESIIADIGGALGSKVVIDTTNPISETEKPDNAVIRYFTKQNESLMERLQAKAPKARFVKAFNSVGAYVMVKPKFPMKPTMFICGNDADAKKDVSGLLDAFGWNVEDLGAVEAARPIEALCQLWCIPGFLRNDWAHAYANMKLG